MLQDRVKIREDFSRWSPGQFELGTLSTASLSERGYDLIETATTAAQSTTKLSRAFHKPTVTDAATDISTESASSSRKETAQLEGMNTYWRRNNWTASFGGLLDTEGTSKYSSGFVGVYVDNSNAMTDLVAGTQSTTIDWLNSGTNHRSLRDKGKSMFTSTGGATEYENATELSGPFASTGKVVVEFSPNLAAGAILGATASHSKVTADTESSAKLAGAITVDEKTYGPNQFTRTLKKKTTFGADDNTQFSKITGLTIVDGAPLSGSFQTITVLLGSDTIDRTTIGTIKYQLYGSDPLAGTRTETADLTQNWWGTATAGSEERVVTYLAGVATTDTYEFAGSKGGNTQSGMYSTANTAPNQSSTITTWTPRLATPDRGVVTGTFKNSRQMVLTKVGELLTFGDYRKSSDTQSNERVDRTVQHDLATPMGQTGQETWKSSTDYFNGTSRHEDRSTTAPGVWNAILFKFDDFADVLTSGTHDKNLTKPIPAGTGSSGQTVTTVRERLARGYYSDRIRGERGRDGDTAKETTTDEVDATWSTVVVGNSSGGGLSSEWNSTDFSKFKTEEKHEYEWANGARALLSATIDRSKTRNVDTYRKRTFPTSWYESTTKSVYEYELAVSGAVGRVTGMQKDYYRTTTVVKDNENPGGSTINDHPTGSPFRSAVAPLQIRWFDDTWVNAAWNLTADTQFGRGVSWVWNNGQDVARIGFGTFDVILGGSMIWTGAGTLPGIGLIALGLDQIATGSMNIRYGRVGQGFSIIEFGVYSATGNETVAILTPGILSLGFGSVGSFGRAGVRAGAAGGEVATDLAPRVFSIGMHPVQARNIPYLTRTPGLGDAIHLEELLRIRGIPGAQGVELASGSITLQVFGRIWALSDFHGIEYGLVKVLRTDGTEVWRLYSGSSGSVGYTIKPGERILRFGGHTHPSGNPIPSFPQWSDRFQRMIGDVATLNELWRKMGYTGRLPHSRVIYGPNRWDTTRYFPDLGR